MPAYVLLDCYLFYNCCNSIYIYIYRNQKSLYLEVSEDGKIRWITVCRGISICLVVLGHTFIDFGHVIFGFHMPLFFFLSGTVFRVKEKDTFLSVLKVHCKRLLIPYTYFSVISIIISTLVFRTSYVFKEVVLEFITGIRNRIMYNLVLWFLPCLFIVTMLFYILHRIIKKPIILIITVGILSYIGFQTLNSPFLPMSSDSACYYLLFFSLGYLMKNKPPQKAQSLQQLLGELSLATVIIFMIRPEFYQFVESKINGGIQNYLFSIVFAMIGIFACWRLAILVQKSTYLYELGENSLLIFSFHIYLLSFIPYIFQYFQISVNQVGNIYAFSVSAFSIYVMNRIAKNRRNIVKNTALAEK